MRGFIRIVEQLQSKRSDEEKGSAICIRVHGRQHETQEATRKVLL